MKNFADNRDKAGQRKKIRTADVLLSAFLIAVSALLVAVQFFYAESEMTVVVRKNSEEIMRVNLSQIKNPYEICIDNEYNIILRLDSDCAEVVKSDCPDKVCVSTGALDRVGMSAVCLPAKVSVEIIGSKNTNDESQLDGVVG